MAFETEGIGIGLGPVRTHVNGMQHAAQGVQQCSPPFHVDAGKCIVLLVLGLGNELVMPYLQ